jgi:ADP-ribose pyrophosphatase YjhB (NUDIX family)
MKKSIDKSLSPKVGVQVLVVKEGEILIGKDEMKGEDLWGVPAGHWENGETLVEAGKREVLEESGIVCDNLKFLNNYDFFREDKGISYVSIGYIGDYISGEILNNIQEGRVQWRWMEPNEALELNLYPAGKFLIEEYLHQTEEK